jgi:sensor histidine kinase YesM
MERHPFIFSDERRYRINRHVAFWLVWYVTQAFLYSFLALNAGRLYFLRLESSFLESLIYLIPHMFLSYTLMYFVIPRYLLKQKYWHTASWVIILSILTSGISSVLSLTIIPAIRFGVMRDCPELIPFISTTTSIFLSLMAGLRGGLTVAGIAAAIKLMKYWYVKEQRNLQLQKENIAAQLQLLKAQVHPHFLFNTLNNIYSYTQKVSPTGSTLVMGLSDLLRYILHEGSKPAVPLDKELKMIEDYMLLEQIRYGDRLDINKELPAETNGLSIAPLLLLPFVENCFKHGTSQMLEQAWIRLAIDIDGSTLKMTLINAKVPVKDEGKPDSGIGISNVRKRLELLYPGKHVLAIREEEDVFIVKLTVELERDSTIKTVKAIPELTHA